MNDGVLEGSEFFLLRERIVLPGRAFVIPLQRVAQTAPDGIIRRHLRQLFELIHDLIDFVFQWLFEISILLFAADCAQLHCKLQQLLLDRCGRFGDGFHTVNEFAHNRPRRFCHVLVSCIFSNIEIFQLRLKDAVGHYRTQFYNGIPFQNRFLICPDHHVNVRMCVCVVVGRIPMQR